MSFRHRRVSDDTQRAPHGNPPAKKYPAIHNRFDTTVLAEKKGLDNVTFATAKAKDFPGEGYELVTFFDCLHDMGDPADSRGSAALRKHRST